MNILVTDAAGFIGPRVPEMLMERSLYNVRWVLLVDLRQGVRKVVESYRDQHDWVKLF